MAHRQSSHALFVGDRKFGLLGKYLTTHIRPKQCPDLMSCTISWLTSIHTRWWKNKTKLLRFRSANIHSNVCIFKLNFVVRQEIRPAYRESLCSMVRLNPNFNSAYESFLIYTILRFFWQMSDLMCRTAWQWLLGIGKWLVVDWVCVIGPKQYIFKVRVMLPSCLCSSVMHQTRAPRVFESCNNSGFGHAHTEPAAGRLGSEMRILNRHLVAQHQHRAELRFAHPSNLAWDLRMWTDFAGGGEGGGST